MMSLSAYPMTPLESLASTAVRTAHKVNASLIVVLTRGGSTARLVAKYRPPVPVLTVVVPVVNPKNEESINISPESPACHALVTRGLLPIFAEGSAARANPADTTDIILNDALKQARHMGYCKTGDSIIALHRMGPAAVIKIVIVK